VTTSWGDVDVDAVEAHTDEIGLDKSEYHDPRQLLRNWRLFDGTHLTIAGTVLFARRPQLHLPYAKVIAARFPGTDTSSDTLDRADISGQLFDVIYRCEGFLRTHLPYEHRIRGFDPERQAELPETALREAVVNALGHRDYTVRGPVRLFVLDDRVEIHTPGTTPNTIDEAAMRAGAHVVRNPHIYARLLEAGLVTSAGTGVRRMSRLVREAVKKDISIAITDAEVLVTLPRLAH
jgi:ATP-dependent DNA helicase RecG